jgi:hypothetical protein
VLTFLAFPHGMWEALAVVGIAQTLEGDPCVSHKRQAEV